MYLKPDKYQIYNRDYARSPMQWNDKPYAGFTGDKAKPWMPLNPNYKDINVDVRKIFIY